MCGPMGCSFCLGMSLFGTIFLSILALLIQNNYQYTGEWYDVKSDNHADLATERKNAVHDLASTAGIYAGFTVLSAGFLVWFAVRPRS
ncbi:hypothetical protein WJX84_001262 [Apatococcus fuscideae]|uniref:Uncharacterized protein n=1 Tax=Apatococcus fuscideae TaxID=2026836 RepID=A0AAW1TEP2_9CHLO